MTPEMEEWFYRSPTAVKSQIMAKMLNGTMEWAEGIFFRMKVDEQVKEGTFKIEDWVE